MSRGRAVIGTTPGGHEDMIQAGETGLLVPGGDAEALAGAMRTLIEDAALRERLGAEARRRSDRFGAAAVVPRFEAVYERLVGEARAARRGALTTGGARGVALAAAAPGRDGGGRAEV